MSNAERAKIIGITSAPAKQHNLKKKAIEPDNIPFPVHALPEPLQQLIKELNETNSFNTEFQAGAAMAVFSAVAGNHYKVKVKEQWTEPVILWIPIVGDPASMKTPALKTYMRPVWNLEKTWQAQHKVALAEYHQALEDKEISAKEPEPTAKELIISSATMEAIFKTLNNNRNGLLLFRDELVGWIKSMNQYRGSGDDQEQWLSIYNNEPLKISRATKETAFIERASVSVLGGIQPAVINELAGSNKDSNGFTYRLSFIFPSTTEVPGWIDREMNQGLIDLYERAITRIINYREQNAPVLYEMPTETKRVFVEWYEENRSKIILSGSDMHKAIYKKLEAQCARIAGIIETIKYGYGGNFSPFIDVETMQSAIEIAEYFRGTSLKAHGQIMENDPIVEKVAELYREGRSMRDISQIAKVSKSKISRWKSSNPRLFKRPKSI